jgi:hypothetical protein
MRYHGVANPGEGFGQTQNVAGLNRLMGLILILPFLIIGSPMEM